MTATRPTVFATARTLANALQNFQLPTARTCAQTCIAATMGSATQQLASADARLAGGETSALYQDPAVKVDRCARGTPLATLKHPPAFASQATQARTAQTCPQSAAKSAKWGAIS